MVLSDLTINEFIDSLASKEPAPGGGSASALAGAAGTALVLMVANLTAGKEKFKDQELLMEEILREAGNIRQEMIALIDRDTEAFNKVAAVFKMPKDTAEEKEKRQQAMQEALKAAAIVPYGIMEKALEALYIVKKALGHTNPAAASDLGVSALCLKTALQGAWLNVKINLAGIKDSEFTAKYGQDGERILAQGVSLADSIYQEVLKTL